MDGRVSWSERHRGVLVGILVVAAVLRLVQLGHEGIWYDEAHSVLIAERGLGELVENLDNQAPLYFAMLSGTVALLGTDEWAVRLPSAAASFATVWLVAIVGRTLLGPVAGLLAAWLVAISPIAVHYAQEARPYAVLGLVTLALFAAADRLAVAGGRSRTVLCAVLASAVVLTHNLGVFYAVGVLAAVAWRHARRGREAVAPLLAVALVTGAVALGWGVRVAAQLGRMHDTFAWMEGVWRDELPWQVPRSLAALGHGSLAPVRNRVGELLPQAWVGLALTTTLAVVALLRRPDPPGRRAVRALVAATVLPLAAVFAASFLTPAPVYVVGRIDSPALPFLMLLAAAGGAELGRSGPWLVAVASAGLATLPLEVHLRVDFRSQERQFAEELERRWSAGEPVVADVFQHSLEVYLGDRPGMTMLRIPPRPLRLDPRIWDPEGGREIAAAAVDRAARLVAAGGGGRFWVVVRPGTPTEVARELAAARLASVEAFEDPRIPTVAEAFAVPASAADGAGGRP